MEPYTHEEYERLYRDALDNIRRKIIGETAILRTGRVIEIDGNWCSDAQVFEKAWGVDAARDIMSKRPAR